MKTQSKLVERQFLLPFVLITSLFALWGFANDITNPMVAGFQTIMELSAAKASLIQFAFYGGYATMAVPAALFIRRYSYKSGILLGLSLYAIGAFLFIPAAARQSFTFFCFSLYILTFGLAFLETTANPFILSLGGKDTSTRRLNLAQSFNPMGSLAGMAVASWVVLPSLLSDQCRDASGKLVFDTLPEVEKAAMRVHDLAAIRNAYVALGVVVLLVLLVIAVTKMPKTAGSGMHKKGTLSRLWHNVAYREGVLAQVFYVGAQIMVWTFIIQYADNLGIDKATAQKYNIIAMGMFLCFRFIATGLMKYVNSHKLLVHGGNDCLCGTAGARMPGGHQCLHVADVPHHLWHCPGRCSPGRQPAGRRLPGDGHRGRGAPAAASGFHHRSGNRGGTPRGQRQFLSAAGLLPGASWP